MKLSYPNLKHDTPEEKQDLELQFAEITWYSILPILITIFALKTHWIAFLAITPMIALRLKK